MVDGHDPTDQRLVTSDVLAAVREFLGGPSGSDDGWTFDFGEHLESNWGAVYGGALAAAALAVARSAAPERSPRSLHIQIVRTVPRGAACATAEVRHSGRTVGTVGVDLYDHRRKLAATALVTMVTPGAVATSYHDTTATPAFRVRVSPEDPDFVSRAAPIIETLNLQPRRGDELVQLRAENVRPSVDGTSAGAIECTVPWDNLECTGPEGACLAADAIVGLAIMRSYIPLDVIGPNADLTLRFTTAPATRVVTAAATMLSVQHGTATVGVEIQAGDHQLAHGLATSLLLPPT